MYNFISYIVRKLWVMGGYSLALVGTWYEVLTQQFMYRDWVKLGNVKIFGPLAKNLTGGIQNTKKELFDCVQVSFVPMSACGIGLFFFSYSLQYLRCYRTSLAYQLQLLPCLKSEFTLQFYFCKPLSKMRSALFWNITQRWMVGLYGRFGTIYRSRLHLGLHDAWRL